ncbi:MAG: DUF4394 domain-containing protein [Reyranella sp.]|uniref:DUF4394 domain-containing protein n=1 Tax=Reyranella sp. TaxID=1929291 RepID=UPI00122200BC|nr:DUF4394 domain-containing protein [Reyranella sp.]TAJ84421.1 MAG: DUF4394 domain-containing protein [Reyranella sp.]TBR26999.1 MAG: DUF4394 domain-containing protein [Reyranella sp.]
MTLVNRFTLPAFARIGGTSLAALAIGMTAAAAHAGTLVGLTNDNKLVKIDTSMMAASAPMVISGTGKLVGIDVRPADGKLWGLTETGQLVTIDPATATATPGSMLSEKVTLGARPVVDFNPVADRLRVIAADGVSLRINVDTGATTVDKPLNYDASDTNTGKKPMVAAGAYTNSMKGAKATELFHVDGSTGGLVLQNPPNDGVLKTRGMVGITGAPDVVMDIANEGEGKNTAWLIGGGTLYTIDLASGKATQVGTVKGMNGKLVDIAVWN